MIPKNIRREHIVKAIEQIEKEGLPKGRDSKKFLMLYEGKYYPPKYVISLANNFVNGKELSPSDFSGGKESNAFLIKLGFSISGSGAQKWPINEFIKKRDKTKFLLRPHEERCPKCKETIKSLLEKIFGKVHEYYKFEVGTFPDDFKNTAYYDELKRIYEALQNHRGFKEFVKSNTLPSCDFFVPNPGFILELDESQHFTIPRKLTLENYPENIRLGFNKERWITLSKEINLKDNDPPFRDEQRAWYDTLRDFIPAIMGLKYTIRLFTRDRIWCNYNPNDQYNLNEFKEFLESRERQYQIDVFEKPEPFLPE